MAEELAFKNGRVSNFEGFVTLTLDRVILHMSCITHRPLLTCQISLKSKELFVDVRTYVSMDGHLRSALLGRLCRRVDLKINCIGFFEIQCIFSHFDSMCAC